MLLIISDDLKASALGCYGNPICQTPHLDALAKQGLVFEAAYCQAAWCAPSRTSLMHSRYRGQTDVNLGNHLKAHGYYSARVGKIYHMRVPGDIIDGTNGADIASSWTERFNSPGQEAHTPGAYACLNLNIFTSMLEGRQSTRMPHRMFVTVQAAGDGSDQPDARSASKAIELLRQQRQQPFFLAVGFVRPHYPMVAPTSYFEKYPFKEMPLPNTPENDLDDIPALGKRGTRSDNNSIGKYPANQKRMWAGYYASVSFMDKQVGRILDELKKSGLDKTTAVIFTSDHGYHLGEHLLWQKSNLHEEVARVPLIISVPGLASGRTRALAELMDVFPTICDLCDVPLPDSVQGRSLVPVLKNTRATVRQAALCQHNGWLLRTADWAYMRYRDGTEELYHMSSDPGQFKNLVNQAAQSTKLQQQRQQLRTKLESFDLAFPRQREAR